jgi:hypothetical protein
LNNHFHVHVITVVAMSNLKEPVNAVTEVNEVGGNANISAKRKWATYFWDTFDKSKEERRFLFKLDTALLTFACVGTSWLSLGNQTLISSRILH